MNAYLFKKIFCFKKQAELDLYLSLHIASIMVRPIENPVTYVYLLGEAT